MTVMWRVDVYKRQLVNTGVHSQYKNDKTGVLHEQERDVAKYWMNGKVH